MWTIQLLQSVAFVIKPVAYDFKALVVIQPSYGNQIWCDNSSYRVFSIGRDGLLEYILNPRNRIVITSNSTAAVVTSFVVGLPGDFFL